MSPAGPDPQRPNPGARPAAAHTEPPRAVLLTGCPILADHVRTLDPRVRAAVVHRLAGSAEPARQTPNRARPKHHHGPTDRRGPALASAGHPQPLPTRGPSVLRLTAGRARG